MLGWGGGSDVAFFFVSLPWSRKWWHTCFWCRCSPILETNLPILICLADRWGVLVIGVVGYKFEISKPTFDWTHILCGSAAGICLPFVSILVLAEGYVFFSFPIIRQVDVVAVYLNNNSFVPCRLTTRSTDGIWKKKASILGRGWQGLAADSG